MPDGEVFQRHTRTHTHRLREDLHRYILYLLTLCPSYSHIHTHTHTHTVVPDRYTLINTMSVILTHPFSHTHTHTNPHTHTHTDTHTHTHTHTQIQPCNCCWTAQSCRTTVARNVLTGSPKSQGERGGQHREGGREGWRKEEVWRGEGGEELPRRY